MGYTCTEFIIDGSVKRNQRQLYLNGNSLDKESTDGHSPDRFEAFQDISSVLKRTFLPVGYPDSVRPEYLTYQFWDSVQGMSSYLRSVLTTRSVLAGAGVGSTESTALAAALTWVFRDGIGMIGSLVFAYHFANAFEINIKEWRYLADVLNNIGLTLDLVSSYFPRYYFALTSISTLCKACCGLIAGATKARISAHFAMPGHLADVTAKESTQETAVALCGLVLGMLLARMIGDDDVSVWATFGVLLCLHQYSNYQLVRVLVFSTLNPQRCWIIANTTSDATSNAASKTKPNTASTIFKSSPVCLPTPLLVSKQETFLRPIFLTYFGPEVGAPLSTIADTIQFIVCNRSGSFIDQSGWKVEPECRTEIAQQRNCAVKSDRDRRTYRKNVCDFFACLMDTWGTEEFVVGVDMNGRVVVSLREGITAKGMCKAHLVAHYVFCKLNCKLALYGASLESKQAYLSEVYHYLVNLVAEEALVWYDSLGIGGSGGEVQNVSHDPRVGLDRWSMLETSSLYTAPWRYGKCVNSTKDD